MSGKKKVYEYHVKTPEGIEHVFTNLAEFCELNNLSKCHLRNMFNSGAFYKGWTGYKVDIKDTKEDFVISISDECKRGPIKGSVIEYTLIDRDNNIYVFRSLNLFCKENSISATSMKDLIDNKAEYRGWKLTANKVR